MDFGEVEITDCQSSMNLADNHYKQIVSLGGDQFKGSITTVKEDIVAMMAKTTKRKVKSTLDSDKESKFPRQELIPFLAHYQDSKGKKYKDGDKK